MYLPSLNKCPYSIQDINLTTGRNLLVSLTFFLRDWAPRIPSDLSRSCRYSVVLKIEPMVTITPQQCAGSKSVVPVEGEGVQPLWKISAGLHHLKASLDLSLQHMIAGLKLGIELRTYISTSLNLAAWEPGSLAQA